MLDKKAIYALLAQRDFEHQVYEHPPVYTIEELDALALPGSEQIVKNLFLRDDKKKNYYLVTLPGHKAVDLKGLREKIPSRKLSFANSEELMAHLKLESGSVTPLGALNDAERAVTVVFDQSLRGQWVGVHPLENTATVFMAFDDLLSLLKDHGSPIVLCDMDDGP